ncbi:Signal transduction histidine kinase [Raineyella antarctica]|uniref:histidine kinase n=1 Tax=Raineyella antarctica TaxID=1577474 RepID=A0A1G6IFQ6_9ACTN|nr:sensor histidine kinase [Raineyella antarctica]SDC05301.1 Signal transduction histidine kinase [Raineyella antarctica]
MDTAGRHGLDRVDAWLGRSWWLTGPLVAVVLVVLLGPASVNAVLESSLVPAWTQALLVAIVVLHVVVSFRSVWPVMAFGVLAVAELVLAIAPPLSEVQAGVYPAVLLPASLAYLLGAHTVSAMAPRPWPAVSLVVGAVGSLVAAGRLWVADQALTGTVPGGSLTLLATFLASVVAVWALGQYRRLRADQVATLAERARRAEADREQRDRQAAADERARIAREMHDVVAHALSVIVRQADAGRYVVHEDPAAAATVLSTIAETGREALTDMRALLGILREGETGHAEATAPQPTLDDLPELVERIRASGQPVTLVVEGRPRPLDRTAHLAGYRLVQEALTNVARHAGPAAEAEVVLTWSRRGVRLQVTDTGGGRVGPGDEGTERPGAPGQHDAGGGGLLGMRERVQFAGGTLRAVPLPGGGWQVQADLPAGRTRGIAGRTGQRGQTTPTGTTGEG